MRMMTQLTRVWHLRPQNIRFLGSMLANNSTLIRVFFFLPSWPFFTNFIRILFFSLDYKYEDVYCVNISIIFIPNSPLLKKKEKRRKALFCLTARWNVL